MATDKPRFSITLDPELLEKVNEHQHGNRFQTQTKAIVDLIQKGLQTDEMQTILKKRETKKAPDTEVTVPRALENVESFAKFLKQMNLVKSDRDISNEDLEFLMAMFSAIKAYFHQKDKGL